MVGVVETKKEERGKREREKDAKIGCCVVLFVDK